MRIALRLFVGAFVVLFAIAAFGLMLAHISIRQETPAMPQVGEVLALGQETDLPVRLSYIKIATQRDPDGSVLGHVAYVIEWKDGRTLLVDTGMDEEAAKDFGVPAEWLLGSDPTVVGRTIDRALGRARERLIGVLFTHIHTDHTQGLGLLCAQGAPGFKLFATPAQFERANYTTRPNLGAIENASCAQSISIDDEGLARLPGLNGVGVIRAAGHTPGSQLIVVWVGETNPRGIVLVGDVVFEFKNIVDDLPKALVYRLFITPEGGSQLAAVRPYLRGLMTDHGMTLIPSHDLAHLESLRLPKFETP